MLPRHFQIALLLVSFFTSEGICKAGSDAVYIRVANQTEYDLVCIKVNFSSEHDYGDLKTGGVSDYYSPRSAHRYAYVEAFAGAKKLICQPIDFEGESTLEKGFYTYFLKVVAGSSGRLDIECRKDPPAQVETRAEPFSKVPTFPVNNGPVDVENSFTKQNPYYKQGAGVAYETEYLGFSAAKLFKLIDLDAAKRVGALDILRGFIYDWLDFDVRDNDQITTEHCEAAVKSMDCKFQRLLSPIQYKIYEIWRDDNSSEVNTLYFLIHYDAKAAAERASKQP